MSSESVSDAPARQFILRAELFHRGRSIIGHTMEISAVSALVRTDEPLSNGDRLLVRLSFPGLLDPFDVEGHVVSKHLPSDRSLPGVTIVLVFSDEEDEQRFRELLEDGSPQAGASRPERAVFHVLLVEDNPTIRDVILFEARRHFRGDRQLRLDLAPDAEQAWALLQRGSYHLAIVDHYLPGMLGAELVARIRAAPLMAGMPIVGVSIGGAATRDAFVGAGADVFLERPLGVRDLFATLDQLLARLGHTPRRRILLVDDSAIFLELVGSALTAAGYQVLCARTVADVERLATGRPDLVLMDVRMPEVFGDELAAMLRGMRGVNVPIHLLSSLEDDDLRERASRAEVDGFISKAFGIDHLIERVRSILSSSASPAEPLPG